MLALYIERLFSILLLYSVLSLIFPPSILLPSQFAAKVTLGNPRSETIHREICPKHDCRQSCPSQAQHQPDRSTADQEEDPHLFWQVPLVFVCGFSALLIIPPLPVVLVWKTFQWYPTTLASPYILTLPQRSTRARPINLAPHLLIFRPTIRL